MARRRKTVEVERIREIANNFLAYESKFHSDNEDFRKGVSVMIEAVLHESGNYNGFGYLARHHLPEGSKVGIQEGDCYEEWFDDVDRTRVVYF